VVVSEYGAHILSWQNPSGQELLFVSEAAVYESGKPIRGGIPLVFPQFSKGKLPQHGFARVSAWKVIREQVSTSGAVSVTLRLVPDEAIDALWPHPFVLEYDVVLTDVLLTTMRVENTGSRELQFTSALHTYFRTSDVSGVEVHGLNGTEFVDFLDQRKVSLETRPQIIIDGPVDRAYQDSPATLSIVSKHDGRRYSVTKEGFSDTVVWNPWIETAKLIADLLPTEYAQMICVESGNVLTPVVLPVGEMHTSAQILREES
jgi:glucose-6-phosphate 1-epimerase